MENRAQPERKRNSIHRLLAPAAMAAIMAVAVTYRFGGDVVAESDDVRPARLAVELAPTGEARRDPASNPVRVAEQAGVRSCPASRGSDTWTPGASPGISDRLDGWSSGTEAACAVRGSIEQGLRLGIGTVIDTLSRFCGAFFRSG